MNYHDVMTPQGLLRVLFDEENVHGIYFEGQKYWPDFSGHHPSPSHPLAQRAEQQLREYFDGGRSDFDLPLAVRGTPFQQSVWRALLTIPAGETCSYMALAVGLGNPRGVRAVAQAIGRNPWSVVVPCHRVIGSSGSLTGYAGGVNRKAWLLEHERKIAS
ncbi:methylated-DNA-[protein]-cysteine S-methyltransferase [Enterobacillus tribolii]|uniref:Methylated-DNA--protein-cysteine methyltransferase n=2 Tax=Enterobacillus tribolii TaxID=1487935 RepID=A0A370QNC6_9GAMM|nr:methylated-DNA--[protein]-cysteine S-methyltransferase [Enterobacillus tribolii]RDK89863.1 methylated-DNA-[protein]-cysteine S-methyltransferase [Enterobacillus tribolii]